MEQIEIIDDKYPDLLLILSCPEKYRTLLKTILTGLKFDNIPILSFEEILSLKTQQDIKLNILSHLSFR